MATTSICAKLDRGFDFACATNTVRKYYQQIVIMNFDDINRSSIIRTLTVGLHNVAFALKTGKKGYKIIAAENGSSISGMFDKTTNELTSSPQYSHKINYLFVGGSELVKNILTTLDRGSFVVAAQLKDGTVEIYGLENGLSNADYTYDLQGGNGGSQLVLQSLENAPEGLIPLVFKSTDPNADFDADFAN